MELKFLGRGSAGNEKEVNTAAYFFDKGDLFLIDCGVTVYQKIIEKDLLNRANNIYLMVTHAHPDHFGAAGYMIINYYWKHERQKKINIVLPKNAKHKVDIENNLVSFGCPLENFNYIDEDKLDNKYETFNEIRYVETKHCDDLTACYGLFFTTNNGIIYYSGDTYEVDTLKSLIASRQPIDKIYMDTSYENNPVHLNINTLIETVPEELKNKVYCMHLDDVEKCTEKASAAGLNVVEVDKSKAKTLVRK